jgi:hypothetical protein
MTATWTFEDIEHVYPWSKWLTATDQEQFLDDINTYVGEHHDDTPEWHALILGWGATARLWHEQPDAMQALVRKAPTRYRSDAERERFAALDQTLRDLADDLEALSPTMGSTRWSTMGSVEDGRAFTFPIVEPGGIDRSEVPVLRGSAARATRPEPGHWLALRSPGAPPKWMAREWAAYITMMATLGLCGVLGRNLPLWWVPVAIVVAVVAGLSVLSVCSFVTAFRCSYKARPAEEERSWS